MKLEQFIIQDGAGYEFTGEFRIPDASEDYWMDPDTVKIVHGDLATYCYRRLIYKLIAPKTVYYKKEGDAYKFTGRIGIATVDEYFLDDKGRMLRGMLFRQDKDYPVYTLLAQKHTEGPSKQDAPPPFIKQGEDYFLYVKTAQVNKGDWYYSTNGNMLNQSVIGGLKVERPIYEKLPLTLIQDDVQYVFTGEYRKVSKDEYYYYYHSKKIYKYEGQFAAESESSFPIYITFEDYYWKKYPAMDAAGKKYVSRTEQLNKWANEHNKEVFEKVLERVFSDELLEAATTFDIHNPPKYWIQEGGLYERVFWNASGLHVLSTEELRQVEYYYNEFSKKLVEIEIRAIQNKFHYYKRIGGIDFSDEPAKMSGAAIQKLQAANRREVSPTECLQLFDYWLLKNPVLDYGHIEYDKKPLFQYFKCEKENGAYTAQTISIMKAIVYNGAAYEKEKTICFPSGHIEGINHRYQKELSFEELKSLNVQFMSIGKFFSSVNDSQFIESAINYKILE